MIFIFFVENWGSIHVPELCHNMYSDIASEVVAYNNFTPNKFDAFVRLTLATKPKLPKFLESWSF